MRESAREQRYSKYSDASKPYLTCRRNSWLSRLRTTLSPDLSFQFNVSHNTGSHSCFNIFEVARREARVAQALDPATKPAMLAIT
jgi:hypothetical protein